MSASFFLYLSEVYVPMELTSKEESLQFVG
jgi:hypothetical protein